ncbi:MAG: alcohol dehydrogenase catalytic domain-containing protein [Planctomycetota bacterium]|jgi:threonine dehydrogenase-like Zn-dependent dehydrogenase|nr:alcohol dehydrogenase catalytic domain-containing protein [Planctomycetota bacterium]
MEKTMEALLMYAPGDFRLERVPVPEPAEGEIVVRVEGAGICAGDVKTLHGGIRVWGTCEKDRFIEAPCIGGHEFIGRVVAVGAGVEGVEIGGRMISEQVIPCGKCRYCLSGNYWMCARSDIYGFKKCAQGGFAEYMKFHRRGRNHRIPPDMPLELALLTEPYACSMHAVERGRIGHDDVVVVSGLGCIGLGMINAAGNLHPRLLIGLDLRPKRLEMAKRFGADLSMNPEETDVVGAVKELTGGYGCDVFIEASGNVGSVRQGLAMIRNLGRFVEFGVFASEITADWNIIGDTKEIDVLGSHLGPYCYGAVIKGLERGDICGDGVISHMFPLREWKRAFETAEKDPEAVKVALIP